MAEAVLRLFPTAKFAIGPAIENGFYYDFDLPRALGPEDLTDIEQIMQEIVKGDHKFVKEVITKDQAKKIFSGQPYKIELIDEMGDDEELSTFTQNTFVDLCRGPHVDNTGQINSRAFKLLSIAGAYWRGDEKKPMLQRIYGTAWKAPKELRSHLKHLEEIAKRDHRKLGRELELFSIHEEAGPGLVYWHPKGSRIRLVVENFWRQEHIKDGYEILYTPHIGKSWLWETSGHLEFFRENMYSPMSIDEMDYYLKPMNCPFHILIYNTSMRSYRELPFRWAELGTVYRYERSGVLHGLLRVRGFTQDDAHIICTPAQIEHEILEVLRFSLRMWRSFGFENIKAYLATKPEKSVGNVEMWETALGSLEKALKIENLEYELDDGGGAFYGPKIDLKINDALGREWQMTTIQFDFNLPERFDMTFVDSDGQEKRPYMVHNAILGSLERFFGVLVEHYGGAFPVWLAPVQLTVIPVADAFVDYANRVTESLRGEGFRVDIDLSDNRMNAKIRNAQNDKIPYMLILGDNEESTNTISLRVRDGEQKHGLKLSELMQMLKAKVDSKAVI